MGINLGDPVFRGVYHGKKVHDDDLDDVLQRAQDVGCIKMMVTGSDLEESKKAVQMAQEHRMSFSLDENIIRLCSMLLIILHPLRFPGHDCF